MNKFISIAAAEREWREMGRERREVGERGTRAAGREGAVLRAAQLGSAKWAHTHTNREVTKSTKSCWGSLE